MCAFCGEVRPPTREHVWGRWTEKDLDANVLAPVNNSQHQFRVGLNFDLVPGSVVVEHDLDAQIHSGSRYHRRLPVVCAACNNGWMSRLERRAEKILAPAVSGSGSAELDTDAQRDVATWLEKTVAVFEFTDPHTQMMTQSDREGIRATGQPAAGSQVWLGEYWSDDEGQSSGRISHTGGLVGDMRGVRYGSVEDLRRMPRHPIRSDILVVGRVFAVVLGGQPPAHVLASARLLLADYASRADLQQIWPVRHEVVSIPKSHFPALNDDDCDVIANIVWDATNDTGGGAAFRPSSRRP